MKLIYLAKNVPDDILSAGRCGERAIISVVLMGLFPHFRRVEWPERNRALIVPFHLVSKLVQLLLHLQYMATYFYQMYRYQSQSQGL